MEQHVFDDCIGNPPFAEAMKTLGGGALSSESCEDSPK